MLINILGISIILLIASISCYILSVLKEKIYLKNNMIVIDKKTVTQSHLEKTDIKEFVYAGDRIKSGDEIKVTTRTKKNFHGILIGIIKKEQSILLVTHNNKIEKCELDQIDKFKVVSKYGKFF